MDVRKRTITIGSDPETILKSKYEESMVKIRSLVMGYISPSVGFGEDHLGKVAELRTGSRGDTNPLNHVQKIRIILKALRKCEYTKEFEDATMHGGSYHLGQSIGGHIHFSFEPAPITNSILDLFLAIPVLMIADTKKMVLRTSKSSYGKLSAYEEKFYGMEYRTLPSWLVSSGFAQAVLCLSYVVGYEINNHNSPPLPSLGMIRDGNVNYYSGKRTFFSPYIIPIFKRIKKMELYNEYRREINGLFGLIIAWNPEIKGGKVNKVEKNWNEDTDLLKRWGIDANLRKYRVSMPRTILFKKLKERMAGLKFDRKVKLYLIPDNLLEADIMVYPSPYKTTSPITKKYKLPVYHDLKSGTDIDSDIYIGLKRHIIKKYESASIIEDILELFNLKRQE